MDSEAEKSVMGVEQATAYARITGRKTTTSTRISIFRFGDEERIRKGNIQVRIPIPKGQHVVIRFKIVEANIPLLVGIDVLSAEAFILDFCAKVIRHSAGG